MIQLRCIYDYTIYWQYKREIRIIYIKCVWYLFVSSWGTSPNISNHNFRIIDVDSSSIIKCLLSVIKALKTYNITPTIARSNII